MLLRGPKQHRLCWECERPVLGRPAPNACGHTLVEGRIKIKHTRKTTLLILLAWASCGWAQPEAGDQVNSKGQLVQDLSGHRWKLKRMRPGQGDYDDMGSYEEMMYEMDGMGGGRGRY